MLLVRYGKDDVDENTNPAKHASVKYKWHEGNFDAISQYLSTVHQDSVLYNNPSAVESWLTFQNVHNKYAAFRVVVSFDHKDKMFDDELWPVGTDVRDWKFSTGSSHSSHGDH